MVLSHLMMYNMCINREINYGRNSSGNHSRRSVGLGRSSFSSNKPVYDVLPFMLGDVRSLTVKALRRRGLRYLGVCAFSY